MRYCNSGCREKTVSETIFPCWIPGADCAIMALRNLQEDKR